MQALERILLVLDAVSRSSNGLAPARVAEETGLSISTVVRLMQSLQDEEVLLRSVNSGNYRIGTRLIALVGRATHSFDARIASIPVLEELRDTSGGETASLHIRNGNQRICVAAAYTTHSFGRIVPIGMALPLIGSAVGQVLLAQLPEDDLAATITSMQISAQAQSQLRDRVQVVKERGFAESVNESVDGIRGIAVPVGDHVNGGALSVSGPSDRFNADQVPHTLERLHHATTILSELGLRLQDLRFA